MDNDEIPKPPAQRQRPVAAPEREVIRSALGLNKPTGGDVIRRNRRRKRPEADAKLPPQLPPKEPTATATVEVTVPASDSSRKRTQQTAKTLPAEPDNSTVAETRPVRRRPKAQAEAPQQMDPVQLPEAAPAPAKVPEAQAKPKPAATAIPVASPKAEAPTQVGPKQRPARAQSGAKLLQTRGLVKVYDGRAVVDGVDINVREQEIVGLLGPNGAGKTTSFYMIVGLVQPNGGRVEFNGADATNEPMYKRARLGMGYLPQEESIFRKLTVKQNIMAVLETQDYSARERKERCHDLMQRFGIEKLANNIAITLSGGEKRRLTIARSLVTNPKLLMLDEPFSGVDPIAVGEIQDIVCDLREQGLAILITDHNVRETLGIVDRAYLICEGKVLMEGSREELVNDPEARKLYLGQSFSM